jgi:hypothetical protein
MRSRKNVRVALLLMAAAGVFSNVPTAVAQQLDFQFFRTRVEPILLKKRGDRARCYSCHEGANNALKLESLSPGSAAWTEEQSRKNFQTISRIVVPGNPNTSRFLLHPLAPEAGGDPGPIGMHHGGRQFESKNDPDWKTLAEWVQGAKGGAPAARY